MAMLVYTEDTCLPQNLTHKLLVIIYTVLCRTWILRVWLAFDWKIDSIGPVV